jgi:uncharacterized protein YkwD
MKLISYAGFAAFVALAACGDASTQHGPTATRAAFSFGAGEFQTLVNENRRSQGLGALTRSALLSATAQGHANDMSARDFFSHTSSDGSGIGRRALAQGYGYCWLAENISVGRGSEAEVFERWMASPGHRENMLADGATEYGLAVAPGNYRVLVLGRPGC